MTEKKTACIQLDREHLDYDVSQMEQCFVKSGHWLFKFMADAKQYITSSLENTPVAERNERSELQKSLNAENEAGLLQRRNALQVAIDLFEKNKPVRLVSFVGQLRSALSPINIEIGSGKQAIWAVKIDPLVRWLCEHSSDKNSSDQAICETRAIALFEGIASDVETKTPPWIVPFKVPQSNDDWFLIPHKNENFMFNLENALWFGKEELQCNSLLPVQEFIRPKPNDDKCVVIKMII